MTPQTIGAATLGRNRAKNVAGMRRRDGWYRLEIEGVEQKFISVTNVLNVMNKPALVTWAARTAAELVLNDPYEYDSAQKAASGIYGKRDSAADRGSTVHSAVEAILNGAPIDIEAMPEAFRGYAQSFARWYETVQGNFTLIHSECSVYSTIHGYAGTTDLVCKLGGHTYLIDFKTGKGLYPEVGLQLSAYKHADLWLPKTIHCPDCAGFGVVQEGAGSATLEGIAATCQTCFGQGRIKGELVKAQPIERTAALLLQENGKPSFQEFEAPLDVFLALKRVAEWQKASA